jgi:hypothetical protein
MTHTMTNITDDSFKPVPPVLVPRLPQNQIPERFLNFSNSSVVFPPIQDNPLYDEQDWVVAPNVTLPEQSTGRPLTSPNGYLSECSESFSAPQSPASSVGTATSVIMQNTNYIQQTLNQISITPRTMMTHQPSATDQSGLSPDPIGDVITDVTSADGYSSPSSATSSHENVATIQEFNEDEQITIKNEPGNTSLVYYTTVYYTSGI